MARVTASGGGELAEVVSDAVPTGEKAQALVEMVRALGYDPAAVKVRIVGGKWPGLDVMDLEGNAIRWWPKRELERRQRDGFLR